MVVPIGGRFQDTGGQNHLTRRPHALHVVVGLVQQARIPGWLCPNQDTTFLPATFVLCGGGNYRTNRSALLVVVCKQAVEQPTPLHPMGDTF